MSFVSNSRRTRCAVRTNASRSRSGLWTARTISPWKMAAMASTRSATSCGPRLESCPESAWIRRLRAAASAEWSFSAILGLRAASARISRRRAALSRSRWSRPMQQRLLCVEAGQTFSIQRVEVLTPQVSSIHRRLTRGRSLVRSQSGPPAAYLRRRGLLWVGWQAATLSRSCHINSRDTSRVTRGHHDTVCPGEIGLSELGDIP